MRYASKIASTLAVLGLAVLFASANVGSRPPAPVDAATEASIVRVTAGILQNSQFSHRLLDATLANAFLDRYLDTLDPDRSLFLQSDLADFAPYRRTLAQDIVRGGDSRMAHVIFERFLLRLGQRTAYFTDALRTEVFEFTGDDAYSLDWKSMTRPAHAGAARKRWRQQLRFEYLQEKLDDKQATQIAATLTRRADRQLQAMRQMRRGEVLEVYLSALAHVYDPHSDYLGHAEMDDFAISMNLSLFGIGAKLQSVDGYCKLIELIPGGPAIRSGQLAANDRIVAVAQDGEEPVDVVDVPLARVVELIRGPKGTAVTLTVTADSVGEDAARRTVRLVRDEIRLADQRASARILDLQSSAGKPLRLGIIDLPSFYADVGPGLAGEDGSGSHTTSATQDVATLLTKLKAESVKGVVLDLRRNGGGSLQEAIELTGLFIARGPVVQTRAFNGDISIESDTDATVAWSGPLVVLTSRFSASASEILAGALQDYRRAVLVGDSSTFGKGTVQSVVPLSPSMDRIGLRYASDPGALKVTIRKFYRPSGASTQLRGVVPDIVVPSLSDVSGVGESALDNPLPWDSVPRARFQPLPTLTPYLAELRGRSARRVNGMEQFTYLRTETGLAKARATKKSVSLNEALRRREIADFEARKKAHETAVDRAKAEAPRGAGAGNSYAITLDNARLPGLPLPMRAAGAPTSDPAGARTGSDFGAPRAATPDEPAQQDLVLDEAESILADFVDLLAARTDRQARPRKLISARADLPYLPSTALPKALPKAFPAMEGRSD